VLLFHTGLAPAFCSGLVPDYTRLPSATPDCLKMWNPHILVASSRGAKKGLPQDYAGHACQVFIDKKVKNKNTVIKK
jgi:hypothetical protein